MEFIKEFAVRTNLPKTETKKLTDAMIEIVIDRIPKGNKVRLAGFGIVESGISNRRGISFIKSRATLFRRKNGRSFAQAANG